MQHSDHPPRVRLGRIRGGRGRSTGTPSVRAIPRIHLAPDIHREVRRRLFEDDFVELPAGTRG